MAAFRKRGRGYQLRYQVAGQRHEETIYARNNTEAQRELDIRVGQALEGRAPTTGARQLRFEDLAAGLESEYKAQARKSGDTLKWRLGKPSTWAALKTSSLSPSFMARRRTSGP
jgi:hypothetical protein